MSSNVENIQADLFTRYYSFGTGVRTEIVSEDSDLSVVPNENGDTPIAETRTALVDKIFKQRLEETKNNPKAFGGLIPKKEHILFSLQKAPGIRQSTIPVPVPGSDNFSVLIRLFNHLNQLNGQSFKDEKGLTHTVTDAPCSCWDRTAPDDAVPGARVVETEINDSIFYGGRPDSEKRAVILGEEIFKNEIASGKKKGIKDLGNQTYELHYLVGSLTNTLPGLSEWRKYVPGAGQALDERDSLQMEVKTLSKLRNSSTPIEITIDGRTYKVRLKPMHTHCMVSCFSFYKFILNGGQVLENEINKTGYEQLIDYYKSMDRSGVDKKHIAWADEIIKTLESEKESTAIAPHLRLAMVDMLAQICKLPVVLHCKSVVDRTSGAGAVSIANRMVFDGKMEIEPANMKFAEIIKQDQYKQNFVMALQAQLSTSSDLRSAVNLDGSINTDRVLPGYEWHEGVDTVAFTFAEFIPKEGLKPITTMQKVKNFAIQLFVFTITTLAYFIGVGSLLKLPIVRPTWLKPTLTFDHESNVLSENGTRPLLVGPHHRRMKHHIKQAETSGKLDINTLNVLRQKAILQGPGFSEKEIDRFKLLKPGVKVEYKMPLLDFYNESQRYEEDQLDRDLYRNSYKLDGENYLHTHNVDLNRGRKKPIKNFVDTQSKKVSTGEQEKQRKYLSQILTQTALADAMLSAYQRYNLSAGSIENLPPEFGIDTNTQTVTISQRLCLRDTQDNEVKYNLDVKIVFPFDHTKGADVEYTLLGIPKDANGQSSEAQIASKKNSTENMLHKLVRNFSTSVRGFLEGFIPFSKKLV